MDHRPGLVVREAANDPADEKEHAPREQGACDDNREGESEYNCPSGLRGVSCIIQRAFGGLCTTKGDEIVLGFGRGG